MTRHILRGLIQQAYAKVRTRGHGKHIAVYTVTLALAAGIVLGAVHTATAAATAPVLSATIDEKVTTGTNKFTYSGSSWTDCGGCNSGAYQNSFKYAYTTGDKVVFTFTGTQAKFYAFKEAVGGIASVSIDGGTAVDVDYYASTQTLTNIYTTPLLASGTHTISLTVSGRKNAASGSPTINMDKAEVYIGGSTTPPVDTTKPTVSVTAPTTGASYTIGTAVPVTATAADNVGVSKVEFYVDGVLSTTDTASPYSYSWNSTGASAGSHSLMAIAYDSAGNSQPSTAVAITLTTPPPADTTKPTVSLTAPAASSTATIGNAVTLSAGAADNVGVTSVAFYVDGVLKNTDAASPYSYSWSTTGTTAGSHSITAIASDAAGNTTTSAAVSMTLVAPADTTAPTVTLTAPTSGSTVTVGTAVTISATASDNVGVSKVELYVDGTLVNTDTATPYTYSWSTTGVATGSHAITAKAYDTAANAATTTASTVTVQAVSAAPVLSATVDERVTTGTNKFTYTGASWTDCGGCNAAAYQNSFRYAYTTGDKAVFTFTGTQVKLYAFKEAVGGIASVSVDGRTAVDVDYYAASQALANVYTSPVLTSGTHTITLTVSGRKNSASGSPTINIDKAEVYTGGSTTPVDTTMPTVSLTAPTNGSTTTVGTAVSLTATATDNVGVSSVAFYVDGVLKNTDTTSPYTYSWDTTGVATGSHSITAKAYDAANNVTTSSAVSISLQAAGSTPILSATIDEKITTGTNHFTYTGASWTDCGGCNSTAYQNSFKYAYTTGDKVVFTFTGTQVKLYAFKEPSGGIASVSIDGGAASDLNYYAASQAITNIYTTPVLTSGTHTLTLTVSGRKSGGSTPTINVDKAEVYTNGGTDPTPPPTSGIGMASLTFDDGTIGQYTYGRPVLLSHNLKATFYIVSDALNWGSTNINATQAKQLVADGDETGNHTRDHTNLATLNAAQIDAEFADAQAAIKAQVGVTPTNCSYPYGSNNSTVFTEAAKYFKACRGTDGGYNNGSNLSPYNLVTFYMGQTTTAAQVRAAADTAKANNQWIIYTFHGVDPSGSYSEDVTPTNLSAQLDALIASGIPIVTVNAALTALGR